MKKAGNRALPLTITLGSILLVFCLALTTLWNIVIVYNYWQLKEHAPKVADRVWAQWIILGIGSFLFVVIIVGITLFIIFMARQIIVNQLQKNFIDSVTHELKTPLTSLKLYVETLQRHKLEGEKKAHFLETMLHDIEHLDMLVNHVLEAAKLDYARDPADFKPLELEELLNECFERVTRHHQIPKDAFIYQGESLSINSDANALKLVFVNLLDNAIKYSQGTPSVHVSVEQLPTGHIQIHFKDQGIGIAAADIKKVFNRFYRGASEPLAKGTGLGLFIVKETLKRLKGRIEVESQGKNQGSTFRVTLPH